MLSVLNAPLSDAAARSGVDGAAGAAVSIVTDNADDATLVLPALSATLVVMLCEPLARVDATLLQLPFAAVVPLPICVAPSNKVTVLPASAVPVKVGVVTLVMLSVLDA